MKRIIFGISCLIYLGGCSQQLCVVDGNCKPIQNAEIYHEEEGVLLFVPWGPFYTDHKGCVSLRPNAISISISKEGYKSVIIDKPGNGPLKVFLYKENEVHESGPVDCNHCTESLK